MRFRGANAYELTSVNPFDSLFERFRENVGCHESGLGVFKCDVRLLENLDQPRDLMAMRARDVAHRGVLTRADNLNRRFIVLAKREPDGIALTALKNAVPKIKRRQTKQPDGRVDRHDLRLGGRMRNARLLLALRGQGEPRIGPFKDQQSTRRRLIARTIAREVRVRKYAQVNVARGSPT